MHTISQVTLEGSPPPWGVTRIGGFIPSALARVQRGGADLPSEFCVTFCPWGERNAVAHALDAISDVFEPRYRLVHFTSCGRPYLVAILTGDDAAARQAKTVEQLPWSEHYRGHLDGDSLTLTLVAETEDLDEEPPEALGERSLRQLFESGELDRL